MLVELFNDSFYGTLAEMAVFATYQ